MSEPVIYTNAALLRSGRDGMVYLDFRLRTPDEADDDLDDLPVEVCVVLPATIARQLADELDRLLRAHMAEVIREVGQAAPDVRADVEDPQPPGDGGNGGHRSPS